MSTESVSRRLADAVKVSRRDRHDGYRRTRPWRLIAGTVVSEIREVAASDDDGHDLVDLVLPGEDTIYTARADEVVLEGERPDPVGEVVALKEALAHLHGIKNARVDIADASPEVIAWIRSQRGASLRYTASRDFMFVDFCNAEFFVVACASSRAGERGWIDPPPVDDIAPAVAAAMGASC